MRAQPASFDDHFSQARLFWLSMTDVEKEHIIRAYSFELNKCYEETIKERQLRCLANIDSVLCSEVAAALGLPVPEPTIALAMQTPSAALSQIGRRWPVDGRTVGMVIDADGAVEGIEALQVAVFAAGMVPLLIAAHGGKVADLPVQRTFATARSVEYDALLLAACPAPAQDAPTPSARHADKPGTDKPSTDDEARLDPRVRAMMDECWLQSKVIGGWGEGRAAVRAGGYGGDLVGVVLGDDAREVFSTVADLMHGHRLWERFPASVS